jgi:hypothetical protein
MKRLFTIIIFFLSTSIIVFSQDFTKKGTWELGGSVGFSSSTSVYMDQTSSSSTSMVSISPEVGYFITNNFEFALLPFSYTSISYGSGSISEFRFLIAPTWNFDLNSNANPYLQALIGYGTINSGESVSGLDYGFQGGVKLQVAKSSILNFGLSYITTNREPSGVTQRIGTNTIQLNAGFSVFLR